MSASIAAINPVPHARRECIRALHVIPGLPGTSVMVFARRESACLQKAGIEVHQFHLGSRTSPLVLIREALRFRREVNEFRPDVVHAHYGTVTALFCVALASCPVVVTFRGSDLNPSAAGSCLRLLAGRLCSQLAALRAAHVICVTRKLQQRLWWRCKRVSVLPGAINLHQFAPQLKLQARRQLGWPANERIVLFNAGAAPQVKRLDIAEEVIERARQRIPQVRLVVLRGEIDPNLIPMYLNAADCLLVTSDWEGSPYIVKEALACNLPIVSVDVGDVAELCAGVEPSRIVPRDREALAAAVVDLLSADVRSNGHSAMQPWSEERVAQRVRDIYQTVLGNQKSKKGAAAE
jgi:glycosyltransferase involved in cell wall biosynthesis